MTDTEESTKETSTSEEEEAVDMNLDEEPVEAPDTGEDNAPGEETPPESEDTDADEDPFPSGTPQSTRRQASSFITRLQEIGVNIQQITPQRVPPEDAEEDAEDDTELSEEDLVLESIVLRCRLNNEFFVLVLPIDEQFVLFQSDYDLLEDMVYSSESTHLGGDFELLNPKQQWSEYQKFREQVAAEQIIGLCRANRNVAIPQLDAWLSLLSTNGARFIIDTTRVNFEYIGGTVQRREYRPAMEITTQDLHEIVMQLLSLRRGVQYILGGAYLVDGIQVPDNFASLEEAFEEARREETQQENNRGPSFRGFQ